MNDDVTIKMEVAIAAAMRAGRELIDCFGDQISIIEKESHRDIASEADFIAEDSAIEVIQSHYPNSRIFSEERGEIGDPTAQDYWIIDALDGSVNYIHQVPLFSVSVAYFSQGQVQAGSVYVPLADDIYYAAKDRGAFKNKSKLCVRDISSTESLFSASFSGRAFDRNLREQEFLAFGRVNDASCGCLRTGSAAINLVYLAEGKFNGCWGKAAKNWDIAAGLLIAQEAGALVRVTQASFNGELLNYIAAPKLNFQFLSDQVSSSF